MLFFGNSYINKSEETALLIGVEEVPWIPIMKINCNKSVSRIYFD